MVDFVNVFFGIVVLAVVGIGLASLFGWATIPVYQQDSTGETSLSFVTALDLTGDPNLDLRNPNAQDTLLCNASFDPVCGVDGNTYTNSCMAQTSGIAIDHKGSC